MYMIFRTTILSALLFGAFLIPGLASAFESTGNNIAYQVTDDTYLFTIEYEFGYLNAEAYLPISAQYDAGETMTEIPALFYILEGTNGERITNGQFASVVLSDAEVRGDYYYIKEGERETFTLLVLYRVGADTPTAEPQALSVTALGNVVDTDEKQSFIPATDEQLSGYQASLQGITVQ